LEGTLSKQNKTNKQTNKTLETVFNKGYFLSPFYQYAQPYPKKCQSLMDKQSHTQYMYWLKFTLIMSDKATLAYTHPCTDKNLL
jgi:hypothetical protein